MNKRATNPDIDLGLEVLCTVSRRGETLSHGAIADVCCCSKRYVYELEKSALRKARDLLASHNPSDYFDA